MLLSRCGNLLYRYVIIKVWSFIISVCYYQGMVIYYIGMLLSRCGNLLYRYVIIKVWSFIISVCYYQSVVIYYGKIEVVGFAIDDH